MGILNSGAESGEKMVHLPDDGRELRGEDVVGEVRLPERDGVPPVHELRGVVQVEVAGAAVGDQVDAQVHARFANRGQERIVGLDRT